MLQNRPLGFWETFKAITHDACHGFETLCMTAQFTGTMNIALFTKALEFIYQRHPLLQATIQEENDVYYYDFNCSFDDIPVQFKKGVSDEILQQSYYDGANCSVEPKKYLWKVDVFYENNAAIFTIVIHHAPCDGCSLVHLVDDILYAYSCYLNEEIPNRANLPLLPPTEHLSTGSISTEHYLKKRDEIHTFTAQKNSIISFGPQQNFVPLEQRSTHVIYNEFSEERTASILKFCAENNFSSNSFLNALALLAAQRVDGESLSIAMLTPVHTRKLSEPAIDVAQVGCHVSLVTTLYENINPNSNILELAHEYQQKLKKEIPKQGYLPKDFSKTDVCTAFGLNLNLDFCKYHLVVSNVGQTPLQKNYKNITLDKVRGGVNNRAGGVACVLVTFIVHNKMHLAFIHTKPLISEKYINAFFKEYMQMIDDLIMRNQSPIYTELH